MDAKGGYGYRGNNSCFVAILDMEILVPVMNQLYCKFSDGAGQ